MIDDIRYGVRMLLRHRGLSFIAILTLSVGIGATATIFSVVDAQLLRALPFADPDRLVLIREVGARGGLMSVAEPNFEDIKAQSQSFSALALTGGGNLVVTGGSEALRTRVSYASEQFFKVLGVQPHIGRTFLPEETKFGGPTAALVSYGYWQRQLGSTPDLERIKLTVDGVLCSLVGVMPQGFSFPGETEVWVTNAIEPPNVSRSAHNWTVIGRLRNNVSFTQARSEVSAIGKRLRATFGEKMSAVDFAIVPLQQHLTRDVRRGLLLLLGAVGLLLVIACANVSNLILTRLSARNREFAVRLALGISTPRLLRQLVFENLTLTLPAALLGTLLASFGVDWLLSMDRGRLPVVNPIGVDSRVLVFAVLIGISIGLVLAAVTLFDLKRQDIQLGLNRSGLGRSFGLTSSWLRSTLAVAQIALTLVLLTGAGLLAHSFLKVANTDPGFSTQKALAMTLALPSTVTVAEDERLRQFYVQVLERIGQLPGVGAVGGINALPLAGRGANGTFRLEEDPQFRGEADYRVASAGYFTAMRIPLLMGRLFGGEDTVNSPHVALISQSLAQKYWPNESALGKRIQFGNMDTDKRVLNVVGVVGDIKDGGLDAAEERTVYAFSLQRPQWWQVSRLSIVVRYEGTTSAALADAMRSTVHSLRADVPLTFRTLDEVVAMSLGERRFNLILFGVFAAAALLIASIGVYGVVSHSVTQRTREIGIRLALGAERRHILGTTMRHGVAIVAAGIFVGMIGAFATSRLLSNLVYGIGVTDPLTFATVSLLLSGIALIACYLPARRATRVDPLIAIRYE